MNGAGVLIVTADDVGLHRGMTDGAIRAHRHGIVTACSVAAAGRELAHARDALAGCPDLDVGVHLVLVGERPVRPPAAIPSLVGPDGSLRSSHREFVARYVLGLVSLADIEAECRAQIERLLGLGFRLEHVNSHQHVHALPAVFDLVARLAREYAIRYVRTPLERVGPVGPLGRRLAMTGLACCSVLGRRRARPQGRLTNDAALGLGQAGHLSTERLLAVLRRRSGLAELVVHPGLDDAALARAYDWDYEWQRETDALCDPLVRARLAAEGLVLTRPSLVPVPVVG